MSEFDTALRYIFVLSVILILVAYYAGTKSTVTAFGTQLGSLINVSTGRNAQGNFAAYPAGG